MRQRLMSVLSLVSGVLMLIIACAPAATPAPEKSAGPQKPQPAAPAPASAPAPAPPPAKAPTPPEKPKYGGTLSMNGGSLPHLDVVKTATVALVIRLGIVYNRLVRWDAGPGVDPYSQVIVDDLAESWEVVNPTTFVFHLKKGVKWQNVPPVNGRELVSDDVKFSIERYRDEPLSSFAYWFKPIDRIELPDRYSVKFSLKEPYAPFMNNIASTFAWIHPKEVVEQDGDLKKTAIGTGPFILRKFDPKGTFAYEKNPNFFRQGMPYLDKVEIYQINDSAAALAALRAGQTHIGSVPKRDFDAFMKTNPDFNWTDVKTTGWCKLYFRADKAPWNNQKVRQAVSLAIDRKAMINARFQGAGYIEGSLPLVLGDWALTVDQLGGAKQWYEYNPERARVLLKEAGYPNGFNAEVQVADQFVEWHEILQGFMKDIGLDWQLKVVPWTEFVTTGWIGEFKEVTGGCTTAPSDPDDYVYGLYHSKSFRNVGKVNDPVLDQMVEKSRAIMDKAARKSAIDEIQRYVADKAYYVNHPSNLSRNMWSPKLKNYFPHALYGTETQFFKVWLEQ